MAAAIRHRGPDDAGVWESSDKTLVLAHQRLAIQDLSALGHQPMASASGRYVIVFNGEIYNFKRLAAELVQRGVAFRGHSDTEVMLAAFDMWGVEQSIQRFDGMFAFTVFDTLSKELWLARDRMGEKPLYYGIVNGELFFCSELKGVLAGIDRELSLNWQAIGSYFRFGYFSVTETPFADIRKLNPASYIRLSREQLSKLKCSDELMQYEHRYWHLPRNVSAAETEKDLGDRLEELLSAAVVDQAVADVGVGVFLSGGIDSTLVAALLQKNSSRKIGTYTIAFDSSQYNEAPFARDVARHIGTDHVEIPVATDDCQEVIANLPALLDEPFADASFIPTYLVCRAARKHVTVCLSGDGGDELFGGYNRYIQGAKLAALNKKIPVPARSLLSGGLSAIPSQAFDAAYSPIAKFKTMAGQKPEKDIGAKIQKIARGLGASNAVELYADLLSFWHESPLVNKTLFPARAESLARYYSERDDFAVSAMECDLNFYLVCDNLFKVDRAAMANSLEVRLPLLDRSLVEFSASVPVGNKIHHGQSKHILREVLYRHVPESLMARPKMGFSLPLDEWLRTGLSPWADKMLSDRALLTEAGLDASVIAQKWRSHQKKQGDYANALWTVLSYLNWRSANAKWIKSGN